MISFYPLNANAQSKKKQIEILKNRLDSVSVLLKVQNESNSKNIEALNSKFIKLDSVSVLLKIQNESITKNIEALNSKFIKLENQISGLNSEIKKSSENLQQKIIKNTELQLQLLLTNKSDSFNIALQEIEKLKSDVVLIPTVKIGNQNWMLEDIKTIKYNNGDHISEAKTEKQWVDYCSRKEGCYRKLNNGTIVYNGYSIKDERGIAPIGFQVPTLNQYSQLFEFLGAGDSQSGKATKAIATYSFFIDDWETGQELEIKSNGSSGFNAKKGGFLYPHGLSNEGNCSYWWTSSEEEENTIVIDIGYCSQDLGGGKGSYQLSYGFALRAIRK